LGLLGVFLRSAFEDGLGSSVDEVLGFLESEGGESTNFLDDGNLLLAGRFEDDVECGLLFSSGFSATSGSRSSGNGGRSGSLDVELFFELLDELGQFDEGELLESLEELVGGELSHGG